jgi:hypothetical protein
MKRGTRQGGVQCWDDAGCTKVERQRHVRYNDTCIPNEYPSKSKSPLVLLVELIFLKPIDYLHTSLSMPLRTAKKGKFIGKNANVERAISTQDLLEILALIRSGNPKS